MPTNKGLSCDLRRRPAVYKRPVVAAMTYREFWPCYLAAHVARASFEASLREAPQDEEGQALQTTLILRRFAEQSLEGRTAIAFGLPASYISIVGQPTMAINGLWNKRCGPGGGTRRLHQFPPVLGESRPAA